MVSRNPDALRQRIARALAAEHAGLKEVIKRLQTEGKDASSLRRLAKKIHAALKEAQKQDGK